MTTLFGYPVIKNLVMSDTGRESISNMKFGTLDDYITLFPVPPHIIAEMNKELRCFRMYRRRYARRSIRPQRVAEEQRLWKLY